MIDIMGCIVSPQFPRRCLCQVSDSDPGWRIGDTVHYTQLSMPAIARGLHLIINRLYCYVAITPQMGFLLVPVCILVLRLAVSPSFNYGDT